MCAYVRFTCISRNKWWNVTYLTRAVKQMCSEPQVKSALKFSSDLNEFDLLFMQLNNPKFWKYGRKEFLTTVAGSVYEPCFGGYPVGGQMVLYSNAVGGFPHPYWMKYEFSECQVKLWKCVNSRSSWLQSSSLYSTEVRGIVNCVRYTVNLALPVAANFDARELKSHLPHTCLSTYFSL